MVEQQEQPRKNIKLNSLAVRTIESVLESGYEAIVKVEAGKTVVVETIRKVKFKEK